MKKIIKVEIGYKKFNFTSIEEANGFAETAKKASDKEDDVTLVVEYKEDEDEI